ncbi:hypothetical protein NDU88_000978 [Pleurodeles waltl]|uniref:Uncharacterized protein n=1 Tax=Pleurodeles waltl TaxID=8319 RepID=A0AAV7SXY6_PLEWA|nr:hypothetical protein NDU88_000978 [Pleurodeles waltl]
MHFYAYLTLCAINVYARSTGGSRFALHIGVMHHGSNLLFVSWISSSGPETFWRSCWILIIRRHLRLEHHNIGMRRRQAPGKKVKAQCSSEPVIATLPSFPVHDISASRSRNDAQMDHDLESLLGNLLHMILLSILEQLEDKLDNLRNTLEDVPSRVAGLMEQIWVAKGPYRLENGGVSLEMVCPISIGDCAVSQSPVTSELDKPGEPTLCLQAQFSDRHTPFQDCMLSSPTDVQVCRDEPSFVYSQCCQIDMTHSRTRACNLASQMYMSHNRTAACNLTFQMYTSRSRTSACNLGFQMYKSHGRTCACNLGFQMYTSRTLTSACYVYFKMNTSCTRSSACNLGFQIEMNYSRIVFYPGALRQIFRPEHWMQSCDFSRNLFMGIRHCKTTAYNNWDQQQNLCPHPVFSDGDEPHQNHCKQPVLINGKEPDECLNEELMCFDCHGPQQNQCLQPMPTDEITPDEHLKSGLLSFDDFGSQQTQCLQLVFQDTQCQQQNLCLKQEVPYTHDPNVDYEIESLHPNAQCPDQKYKVEPLHTAAEDQELGPMHSEAQEADQNYKLEPIHQAEQDSNQSYKLEPPCTESQCSDQNDMLEPSCTDAQDSDQNYKLEPLSTDSQGSDQNYKPEPPCTDAQDSDRNYKLKPSFTDSQGSDQNYKLEPPCTDAQGSGQNDKLRLLSPDEWGPSVPASCLKLDRSTADENALTDSMERGNTKSDLLLFQATTGMCSL